MYFKEYHVSVPQKGLVTLAIIEDDNLRSQLTNDDATTVVFKYRKTMKELMTEEEKEILSEIIEALPEIESIDPEKFKVSNSKLLTDCNLVLSGIPYSSHFLC